MKYYENLKKRNSMLEEIPESEYTAAKSSMSESEFKKDYFYTDKRYKKRIYPTTEELNGILLDKINSSVTTIAVIVIVSLAMSIISIVFTALFMS